MLQLGKSKEILINVHKFAQTPETRDWSVYCKY